jgi:hypothetical protein
VRERERESKGRRDNPAEAKSTNLWRPPACLAEIKIALAALKGKERQLIRRNAFAFAPLNFTLAVVANSYVV